MRLKPIPCEIESVNTIGMIPYSTEKYVIVILPLKRGKSEFLFQPPLSFHPYDHRYLILHENNVLVSMINNYKSEMFKILIQ